MLRFHKQIQHLIIYTINSGSNEKLAISSSISQPSQVGQILFSVDGLSFTPETPVTSQQGWLVNEEGILIVNG